MHGIETKKHILVSVAQDSLDRNGISETHGQVDTPFSLSGEATVIS